MTKPPNGFPHKTFTPLTRTKRGTFELTVDKSTNIEATARSKAKTLYGNMQHPKSISDRRNARIAETVRQTNRIFSHLEEMSVTRAELEQKYILLLVEKTELTARIDALRQDARRLDAQEALSKRAMVGICITRYALKDVRVKVKGQKITVSKR